jgi:hypothetical protein
VNSIFAGFRDITKVKGDRNSIILSGLLSVFRISVLGGSFLSELGAFNAIAHKSSAVITALIEEESSGLVDIEGQFIMAPLKAVFKAVQNKMSAKLAEILVRTRSQVWDKVSVKKSDPAGKYPNID